MTTIATRLVQSVKRCGADGPTPAPDQPMSILVVDDEESIRRYVDRVLSAAGYRTTIAVDGADAIAAVARGGRFDLLLTDVMMPEMTGDELAVQLREGDPALKVLYLTGYSDHLFKEKATLRQEEAFLDKPCSPVALRQAVSLAITGRVTSTGKPAI
jgi:two-component system, cell cycle sensor histidine kinase and response regulator CckA